MTKFLNLFVVMLTAGLLTVGGISEAEAKRFGGGSSFGGKSSFGSPAKKSTAARTPAQQKAATQNNQARQQMKNKGGMMGLLGGLAIGGLLGAMFFGGAFENINFMDILLFAGIAFLLFKLLKSRKPRQDGPAPAGAPYAPPESQHQEAAPTMERRMNDTGSNADNGDRNFDTDVMFGKGAKQSDTAMATSAVPPADFDQADFLEGAEGAFRMLQEAWNNKDLGEMRRLCSDEMFAQIQDQFRAADADYFVQLLKLDAELLEVREVNGQQEATVLFDALMRESEDDRPMQVREIWHFNRSSNALSEQWFLDGIQQLEE